MDDVGLENICGAGFQNLAKTVVGKVTLARGDWNSDLGSNLLERGDILGRARLLDQPG